MGSGNCSRICAIGIVLAGQNVRGEEARPHNSGRNNGLVYNAGFLGDALQMPRKVLLHCFRGVEGFELISHCHCKESAYLSSLVITEVQGVGLKCFGW